MVQEPVQEADGGAVLGEEPSPFLEGPVAGDGEAAAFVGAISLFPDINTLLYLMRAVGFDRVEVVQPSPLNEQLANGKRAMVAGWVDYGAHGTAATTTPCSGHVTRGASASTTACIGPRSSARQRRRPAPWS